MWPTFEIEAYVEETLHVSMQLPIRSRGLARPQGGASWDKGGQAVILADPFHIPRFERVAEER